MARCGDGAAQARADPDACRQVDRADAIDIRGSFPVSASNGRGRQLRPSLMNENRTAVSHPCLIDSAGLIGKA